MTTSTMRAVQARTAGGEFTITELPVPEPAYGQVRVAVHACGVCGGDAIARFGLLGVQLPRVPGHEVAGVVDAIGDGVTGWAPGDRVGVGWHGGSCFTCPSCRRGDFVNCVSRTIVGVHYDGGYADYLVAPQDALAKVPDELTFAEAGPLMCAGITTFNALRHSPAQPGDTVAIHGVGGLGHLAVQFADKMGFRTVAINRGKAKEKLALDLGADEYIDSEDGSAGEALARLGGASTILGTVGSSPAQADLVQGLAPNGKFVIVANDHQPLEVATDLLVFGRREVAGWYSGHAADSEDAMNFAVLKGIRPLVQTFPLAEAEQAFQSMNKVTMRAVLTTDR